MVGAVIVAGGSSRRMGFDKMLAPLGGRPVVAHAAAAFAAEPAVSAVVVVAPVGRIEEFREAILPVAPGARIVAGGAERHLSVWNGLQALPPEVRLIAVHDGARPLVGADCIRRCIEAAGRHRAASAATPVTETLKRADAELAICGSVEREGLWAMQTPQVFEAELLREAYRRILAEGVSVTDENSAVERLGVAVRLVPDEGWNPKITFPRDLVLAEAWWSARAGSIPEPAADETTGCRETEKQPG